MESLPEGGVLIIDAENVEIFDYSFANELFGKLLLRLQGEYQGKFIVIDHLSRYARENLNQALEALGLVMLERRGAKLELLGKVRPPDLETFQLLRRAKTSSTAQDLSGKLKMNLTAVNERLAKLANLGVIRRAEGQSAAGRTLYEYRLPA